MRKCGVLDRDGGWGTGHFGHDSHIGGGDVVAAAPRVGWTFDEVWCRIVEAADTLRRLPSARALPRGFHSAMPEPVPTPQEAWLRWVEEAAGIQWGDPQQLYRESVGRPAAPSATEISQADEVVGWIATYPLAKERWSIWAVALGWNKKRTAKRLHCNRASIYRWREKGVDRIVRGLNG